MNLASLLNACMTNLEGTRPSGAGIQSTVDAARWEPADVRFLDMTAVTRFWPESATTIRGCAAIRAHTAGLKTRPTPDRTPFAKFLRLQPTRPGETTQWAVG